MASKEMIERAAKAVKNEFSKVVGEFGLTRAKEIVPSNHRYIRAALNAARPAPEAGSMAVEDDGTAFDPYDLIRSQAAQIASLSAKVAEVQRERDEARRQLVAAWNAFGPPEKRSDPPAFDADDLNDLPLWAEGDLAEQIRCLEDCADRLRAAIADALGRHQVTHIHAGLRAALQQEGKSDA